MAKERELTEAFLIEFVTALSKSMKDSGLVIKDHAIYPDIDNIKKNIKIYEHPESTIANAILMSDSLAKKPLRPRQIRKFPLFNTNEQKFRSLMNTPHQAVVQRKWSPIGMVPNFAMSHQMPFMYPGANSRVLPSYMAPATISMDSPFVKPAQREPEKTTEIGIPRLDQLLSDPLVQTIECPGPNKPILISKGGKIQSANLTLTNDEIKNAMSDISEKTRIPLMQGVFKAAFGNLIITSVMSEFVGTRFIIQKKPQMQSQANSIYQQ